MKEIQRKITFGFNHYKRFRIYETTIELDYSNIEASVSCDYLGLLVFNGNSEISIEKCVGPLEIKNLIVLGFY
jgi:hypothetical protein